MQQSIIFINHRRTDAGWPASFLAEKLSAAFGKERVFQDVRNIQAGDDLSDEIMDNLARTTVLLVLIGAHWLTAQDKYGRRRLDKEDDWVRREIRFGLEKADCKVIPVLIDDAGLPDDASALPDDMGELLRPKWLRVRQANGDDDVDVLIRVIENSGFQRVAGVSSVTDGENWAEGVEVASSSSFSLSGPQQVELCRRLGGDWQDLADYLEIPLDRQRTFPQGRECREILAWVVERDRMPALPEALAAIGRDDLTPLLQARGQAQPGSGPAAQPVEPRLLAHELLNKLLQAEFESVVFRYPVPDAYLPRQVAQAQQAINVIQYALGAEGEKLDKLLDTIYQVAPRFRP